MAPPEQLARQEIDRLLSAAGWAVQDFKSADLQATRWRVYEYNELEARDKASLDIFGLKHEALPDSDNLAAPEVIAREIVDDLEAALEQFRLIAGDLQPADRAAP